MSIKYDSKREPLAEIIKKATTNATLVIPDLQRPYVWTPRQVTLLVDSLFRGWPFGSLLLWEVKPDCFSKDEGIPHRPFWQVVDRTDHDEGAQASPLGPPATYQMVLDGQQRVQSLILALGGDQWGFRLYDHEWALDLQDRRLKASEHWSKASLCLDLHAFRQELGAKQKKVRKVEIGKVLEWVITSPEGQSPGARPANYGFPVVKAADHPGRFVRLSRLWDAVQKDLSEDEYWEVLLPIMMDHGVLQPDELERPLSQFMKIVENVKFTSFVHALQIESFQLTSQWSKDDYSDAIVNIFTRLNTAGRTLTREEITLAWLKVGWDPKLTSDQSAAKCLESLQTALESQGFHPDMDEIVRLISFIWAVDSNDGVLLDSKDLLKGDVIRRMAGDIASSWMVMKPWLEAGAEVFKKRELVNIQGSFNAVIVYLAWYRLVFEWLERAKGRVSSPEHDSLEKQLSELAATFLDRWLFGSQWANLWGESAVLNFQNCAKELNRLRVDLAAPSGRELPIAITNSVANTMGRAAPKALEHINTMSVRSRHHVHKYFELLWVWHRLDSDRWDHSSIPMKTGRKRTTRLEVDHTIADAWWQRTVDRICAERLAVAGADDDPQRGAPDGFESKEVAAEFVNSLGNCSLLDKSFNISKSDKPFWALLQEVHEFKRGTTQRADWEKALLLTPSMTEPTDVNFANLVKLIRERDAAMRRELAEFMGGTLTRRDI